MKQFIQRLLNKKPAGSASIAKERLQIIVSHERTQRPSADFLPKLQRELVEVIAKYVHIDPEQVKVDLGGTESCSVLELNIALPNLAPSERATA